MTYNSNSSPVLFGQEYSNVQSTGMEIRASVHFESGVMVPTESDCEVLTRRLAWIHEVGMKTPAEIPPNNRFRVDISDMGEYYVVTFVYPYSIGLGFNLPRWRLDHIEIAVERMLKASEFRDDTWEVRAIQYVDTLRKRIAETGSYESEWSEAVPDRVVQTSQ